MANIEFFNNSQGVHAETIKFVTTILPQAPSGGSPLEKLEARIAEAAIHDSAERCDAPKCDPETRVAVQDDLYSWIVDGDGECDQPKKIKWVTGPAGTGKTAVMGSLAKRCKSGGVLAATFFFASWSMSIGRRRKTAFVTTIAHQLARYHGDLREEISKAIDANSDIFGKDLHTQMEILIRGPLQKIARPVNRPGLQGAIIVDGLDECEAEQYHDVGSRVKPPPERTNDRDQLEILQVLREASSDPSFPFLILIASRPERVFREFFDPENNPTPFAHKLDLHEAYNANADITLFLEAHFNTLRRRYRLPSSWPTPETIQTLVENASGQFIYAATIIRFLDTGRREPPKALLEAILKMKVTTASNPLEQLDILYSHVLESSPDPALSVRWICTINKFRRIDLDPHTHMVRNSQHANDSGLRVASNMNFLLQTDSESSDAEHLLGNLHSLIRIPPPSDQMTTEYDFYHKSLFDFLEDPDRCGKLYFSDSEIVKFIWDRFVRACTRGCNESYSYPGSFPKFLARIPGVITISSPTGGPFLEAPPAPAIVDWWVSLVIAHQETNSLKCLFQQVHLSCSYFAFGCKPVCKAWSSPIVRCLGLSGSWWDRTSVSQKKRFYGSIDKAIEDAKRHS